MELFPKAIDEKSVRYLEDLDDTDRGFICPITKDASSAGRRIRNQINFEGLRGWIQCCESNHPACNALTGDVEGVSKPKWSRMVRTVVSSSSETPERVLEHTDYLKLIDVQRRCLVKPRTAVRYFTLSYVRGNVGWSFASSNDNSSWEEDSSGTFMKLPAGLPQTIEDTMVLVDKLKGRYLWTDLLCIDQSDPVDVRMQMRQMDEIYSNAICCIAAMTGNSASSGLPGISMVRQSNKMQYCISVDSLKLGITLPKSRPAISQSIHSTRAWTYQEMLLSKRILYVMDDEVLYGCARGFERESVWGNTGTCSGPGAELWDAVDATPNLQYLMVNEADSVWTANLIIDIVKSYSTRRLTFQSDALEAFGAIAFSLARSIGCVAQYGMFFNCTREKKQQPDLWNAVALTWDSRRISYEKHAEDSMEIVITHELARRLYDSGGDNDGTAMFPSWAWCAWLTEIEYLVHGSDVHEVKLSLLCLEDVSRLLREHDLHVSDPGFIEDPFPQNPDEVTYRSLLPSGIIWVETEAIVVTAHRPFDPGDLRFPDLLYAQNRDNIGAWNRMIGPLTTEDDLLCFAALFVVQRKKAEDSWLWEFAGTHHEEDYAGVWGLVLRRVETSKTEYGDVFERVGIGIVPLTIWERLEVKHRTILLA